LAETVHLPEMPVVEVLVLLTLFDAHGIPCVIDGGWAVDAVLGEQTRPHSDLDIVIPQTDVPKIRALLGKRKYRDMSRPDTRECNFVMGDARGHDVDIHTVLFDENGNNTFGVDYPFESLKGYGTLAGHTVRCVPVEWLVKFHTGYELDENDYHDMKILRERFGMMLPAVFKKFQQ
jgi:lincosamide nucleotidyltransferase A/C/D/E